tara:strand:- start:1076 stop:1714 length:639 start_codon:yes stop_codon:yes gene_type:complete
MIDTSKIYTSNNCGKFKIVNYISAKNVKIRFVDTGQLMTASAGDILRGKVKDRSKPTVYGVGFIGVGGYKSIINGSRSRSYNIWVSMIQRCYSKKCQATNPTYKDCSVCDDWLDFQVFAKWFDDNYVDGYHLDKDIKNKGNKIYSPENCLFVSQNENTAFAFAKHYKFISPKGEAVSIYNMRKFCRDNGVTASRMNAVHRGNEKQHKGWTKA